MYLSLHYPYPVMNILLTIFTSFLFVNILVLLIWVLVLFQVSIRLRRRLKFSTDDSYSEVLNTRVEYYKHLFLLAISFFELSATLFEAISNSKLYITVLKYHLPHNASNYNEYVTAELNSSLVPTTPVTGPCNISHTIPYIWSEYYNVALYRFLLIGAGIFFYFTFSLVYTLMSYLILVTRNSLSYGNQTQVNLGFEQKVILILSTFAMLCAFATLVRVEIYLMFALFAIILFIIQFTATLYYSLKLSRVLSWKLQDLRIAFGTQNYLYLNYLKGIRTYKRFFALYNIMVGLFCLIATLRSVRSILALILNPYEIYEKYRLCFNPHFSTTGHQIFEDVIILIDYLEKICFLIYLLMLFAFNICSLHKLLSKVNLSCHLRCTISKLHVLKVPLLINANILI